jgi:uncharacterized protein (DUF58 family)
MSRPLTWLGPADTIDEGPLVSLADISEIELLILKRMREFTIGEHSSLFHGSGFDFTGVRDWQAGDRFESIDWPQSSLTNFSPLIVREFDQRSTSNVVIVADQSASTRCGLDGVPVAAIIARAIATIGMSAVFFQDAVGLITFDERFATIAGLRPRIGKNQVINCLDVYQRRSSGDGPPAGAVPETSLHASIAGFMRKTSLVPVISDFLFEHVEDVIRDLARLNSLHDVFLTIVDASFAFDVPKVSAGWVEVSDVETGRSRIMSKRAARRMAARVLAWQDDIVRQARGSGLDVLRLGLDQRQFDIALMEFVIERRLRRKIA